MKNMKKMILISALFLIASLSFAQEKKISWLDGQWTGEGYQPKAATQQSWPMQIDYKDGILSVFYSSFPCGGTWELVKAKRKKAIFIERISEGTDKCANNSTVIVKRGKKQSLGTLNVIFMTGKTIDATATLHR
jgi:hypothetical protein